MNHHGDPPLDVATDWTTVSGNATKKQAPHVNPGQSSKKSNHNEQVIGEIGNLIKSTPAPRRNESLFVTRINFKVIPTREIKTIYVPLSICHIVASIKAADRNARLIAVDDQNNEIELKGSKDLQKNTEANQHYVNQFIDQPKINKSNQLVGLILLRSDIEYKDIKKHQVTQKGLKEIPRIFLTANYLDVVTPAIVGFFVNTGLRADNPKTFMNMFNMFMSQFNDGNIKFHFEYGPIWGPNHRISVIKLMDGFEDKDALRCMMENFHAGPNEDTYVCITRK